MVIVALDVGYRSWQRNKFRRTQKMSQNCHGQLGVNSSSPPSHMPLRSRFGRVRLRWKKDLDSLGGAEYWGGGCTSKA